MKATIYLMDANAMLTNAIEYEEEFEDLEDILVSLESIERWFSHDGVKAETFALDIEGYGFIDLEDLPDRIEREHALANC